MPFKKIKRAVKKITKPVAKVLDKVVPNEIKPALPYLSAFTPFMFGPTFGTGFGAGIFKTAAGQQMAARALAAGAANLGSQLAQEGSEGDFSLGSLAIASGLGALSAPGAQDAIAGSRFTGTPGVTGADAGFYAAEGLGIPSATPQGFIGKGLTKAAEGVQATGKVLRDPFSATLKDVGKAAFTPLTQGTTDLAMATARKALKDYEDELAAYELETGEAQTASDAARRTAIINAMTAGQHSQDVIDETLALLGLKDGGRVGLREGGVLAQILPQASQITALGSFQPFMGRPAFAPTLQQAQAVFPRLNQLEQGVNRAEEDLGNIRERLGDQPRPSALSALQGPIGLQQAPGINMLSIAQLANRGGGDLQGMKDGGIMDLGGKEMDLRGGGFVPIGKKERADDVPARLSKNEFVMTADAVRGAGGGDINEGARRMYETMNKLEARA